MTLYRKNGAGCPRCYTEDNVVSFPLEYTKSFTSALIKKSDLKSGSLFVCASCNSHYYLLEKQYHYVEVPQLNLLEKWFSADHSISDTILSKASEIGIIESWSSFLSLPCIIELKNGEVIDFSILIFSKDPPYNNIYAKAKNIFFAKDIVSIERSEYAVSKEIRYKCSKAREIRMGFCPTLVSLAEGKKIVLNGITNFFIKGNFKGNDLTCVSDPWDTQTDYEYYQEDIINYTYVICLQDERINKHIFNEC